MAKVLRLRKAQEFTQAVEAKQIAQQDAERAKFVVEKVRSPILLLGCPKLTERRPSKSGRLRSSAPRVKPKRRRRSRVHWRRQAKALLRFARLRQARR